MAGRENISAKHLRMQKSLTSSMRRRILGILICFLVFGFAVLIAQLFKIQIVHGEEYQARASQQQTRATTLGAERGAIYDRNGNVLVRSGTVWNVCLSPADITTDFNKEAKALGAILDVDPAYILEQASDRRYYYKLIKRRVDGDVREAILQYITQNDVAGVFFELDTKRFYIYDNLASTVLGFTNFDNHGAYGLEAYYDKVLSGTPGMVVSAKNALGSDMPYKNQQINEAQDGNSLVLTLDEGIQHFLEKNLETAIVEHFIGNRACGIVMDVKTGEILAMSTKPDFDPNNPYVLQDPQSLQKLEEYAETYPEDSEEYQQYEQDLRFAQWRNKAITDPYEPGSVFKIITAATALDNKVVQMNEGFYCSGAVKVASEEYHCHKLAGHGQQTFVEGMMHSCNPVFIAIGQRIGGATFYNYIDNFGLRDPTGVDLPGEAGGILHSMGQLTKEGMVELSSTSFGQTFKATPLQIITAVSAAVNGGNLMQPYLVKRVQDSDGNVIETTQPTAKRQVISEETSALMRELVEAVVGAEGGSGKAARVPGYRIGGKTGTSEILDQKGNERNVLSFVGFAPMEDPRYAVLVVLDEPQLDNVYGSVIAAPVVGAILQEMLPYVGIEPTFTEEERSEREVQVPNLIGQKPHDAQAELTSLGLQTRVIGNGPHVVQQIPQAGKPMPKGMTVTFYTDQESLNSEVTVPDVVGMTAQEANKAIVTDAGLNIELRGVTDDGIATVVGEQWPLPGTVAQTGDLVVVTLMERQEEAQETMGEVATVMP